jgi:hypothetical protein
MRLLPFPLGFSSTSIESGAWRFVNNSDQFDWNYRIAGHGAAGTRPWRAVS